MIRSKLSSIDRDGENAILTIENGKKNLLSDPEFIDSDVFINFFNENRDLKGLIITGAGRHFSHGADVSRFVSDIDISVVSKELEAARKLLRMIEHLPVITAAAINGGCFGGGLEIALSCQFRICSKNAFLGLPEIMHGVIPGMGGMERIARLLGREKAVQMCLSGEILNASDSLACGLVTKVTENKDCLDDTVAFVNELSAGKSVLQINSIIDTINSAWDGTPDPSKGKFVRVLQEMTNNNHE